MKRGLGIAGVKFANAALLSAAFFFIDISLSGCGSKKELYTPGEMQQVEKCVRKIEIPRRKNPSYNPPSKDDVYGRLECMGGAARCQEYLPNFTLFDLIVAMPAADGRIRAEVNPGVYTDSALSSISSEIEGCLK